GTFFLQQNRLHNIYRGFTHYKYYRASKNSREAVFLKQEKEKSTESVHAFASLSTDKALF
ncbi:hypothetical protein OJ611_08965, partial [Streptococcus anginosus]|uniref:hypothetical protein n=1 Tax=Streptococcus anginosus TaxID=1328 RepID=UPI0022208828